MSQSEVKVKPVETYTVSLCVYSKYDCHKLVGL